MNEFNLSLSQLRSKRTRPNSGNNARPSALFLILALSLTSCKVEVTTPRYQVKIQPTQGVLMEFVRKFIDYQR